MLLCKDCKHINATVLDFIRCGSPKNIQRPTIDYVGLGQVKPTPIYYQANLLRADKEFCGPEAKWFEAKDSK